MLKDRIESEILLVSQVYFSLKFDETRIIYNALGKILADAQEFHQKSFPLIKLIQRFVIVCLFIGMTTLIIRGMNARKPNR